MEQGLGKLRFLIIHMLQYEMLVALFLTSVLLWLIGQKLSRYSTTNTEALIAKRAAWGWLAVLGVIAFLGRVLLR